MGLETQLKKSEGSLPVIILMNYAVDFLPRPNPQKAKHKRLPSLVRIYLDKYKPFTDHLESQLVLLASNYGQTSTDF